MTEKIPPHVAGRAVPENPARDGAGKAATIHETPPAHPAMASAPGVTRNPLANPAPKNIPAEAPDANAGMARGDMNARPHPDDHDDTGKALGGAVISQGRLPVSGPTK